MAGQRFVFGPFVLDEDRGALVRDGRPVGVGNHGLLLLQTLLAAHGHAVSKAALMDAAWPDMAVEESNLSVQIAALRKLLGPSPNGAEWIATIPRVGYRFVPAADSQDSERPSGVERTEDAGRRPSIIVLPFANLSHDDEQEYLVDGITDDIITALTRFRWFFVIARNSSFAFKGKSVGVAAIAKEVGVRYTLEGSVRKSGRRVRISAQLNDARTGNHIWAERYDLDLTELFAIQDEIAERVAGALEPELLKNESLSAVARHTGNMTAWDLVRKGTWHFHHVTRDRHLEARELFRKACKLDPELPETSIWLARVSAGLVAYGWSEDPKSDIQEGIDAALRALRLDERNPYSHYALAITSVYANVPEQAIPPAERAVEISPSFALGHLVLGMARLFMGHAAEAVAPFDRGLTLNPYDPQNFVWFNLKALAHLFTKNAEEALQAAIKSLKVRPSWRPIFETLVSCYSELGRMDDARRCVDQMRSLEKSAGDALMPLKTRNPQWREQLLDALRKAGWQE
ncbi:MAG TPA: winged helix-turn-helix domain-containing protein [Stellaceae bacterium]|nr:winged helix-turn-helix domain-containing protein [Stellaceae bacterium]